METNQKSLDLNHPIWGKRPQEGDLTVQQYEELTAEEKRVYIRTNLECFDRDRYLACEAKRDKKRRSWGGYLPCLYCDFSFTNCDTSHLKVTLDPYSIFNGRVVVYEEGELCCDMSWRGYACQFVDGSLYLTQVCKNAKIDGTIGEHPPTTETFSFEGCFPVGNSVWPDWLHFHQLLPTSPLYEKMWNRQ